MVLVGVELGDDDAKFVREAWLWFTATYRTDFLTGRLENEAQKRPTLRRLNKE